MTLNEKFGRGANLNKVSVAGTPDVPLLRRLLTDLSDAATAAQCDITWQSGEDIYSLTITHSRHSPRAEWKLCRIDKDQSTQLWSHATNDIKTVHRLILEAHKQTTPSKTQTELKPQSTQSAAKSHTDISALKAATAGDINSQERRAININNNLSGKLRKLFIGAQEDIITGSQMVPVGRSRPMSQRERVNKPATFFMDMTPGREILQNLFMGQFGIFSYPTFLFFLEREYFNALENKIPVSLIILKATSVDRTDASAIAPTILQEIARRIKLTQRKTDILAQYEDGKFAVLLPETDSSGARGFIQRVEKALLKLDPTQTHNTVNFTFGIATLADHCKNLHMYLTYANKALELALQQGNEIATDDDILKIRPLQEDQITPVDLAAARKLVAQLISVGIFTYPAFLAFLEQEYYRAVRKEVDQFVLILKVRQYEGTFDEPNNLLPQQAYHEVIRRVGMQLNKRDIFAHYTGANFAILRSNATDAQMDAFGKKLIQAIIEEEWLTPECPASSLVIQTQVCLTRAHPTAPNLFSFVPTA